MKCDVDVRKDLYANVSEEKKKLFFFIIKFNQLNLITFFFKNEKSLINFLFSYFIKTIFFFNLIINSFDYIHLILNI